MNMTEINGASEGSIPYLGACLAAAWYGDNVALYKGVKVWIPYLEEEWEL